MSVIQKQINVNEDIDSVCEDFNRKIKLKTIITPEDVLKLTKITEEFLCDNINEYQIEFTRFKIRDLETDTVLFDISKESNFPNDNSNNIENTTDDKQEPIDADSGRFVRYLFSKSFLNLKHIGAT
jgi:protein unc-119